MKREGKKLKKEGKLERERKEMSEGKTGKAIWKEIKENGSKRQKEEEESKGRKNRRDK